MRLTLLDSSSNRLITEYRTFGIGKRPRTKILVRRRMCHPIKISMTCRSPGHIAMEAKSNWIPLVLTAFRGFQ